MEVRTIEPLFYIGSDKFKAGFGHHAGTFGHLKSSFGQLSVNFGGSIESGHTDWRHGLIKINR